MLKFVVTAFAIVIKFSVDSHLFTLISYTVSEVSPPRGMKTISEDHHEREATVFAHGGKKCNDEEARNAETKLRR